MPLTDLSGKLVTPLYQLQLLFTTRLSATKVISIYSSQGNYLQLDKVD